jgi:hypothetical protein
MILGAEGENITTKNTRLPLGGLYRLEGAMKRWEVISVALMLLLIFQISGGLTVRADNNARKSKLIIYTDPSPELSFILTDPLGNSSGWDAVNRARLRGMNNSNILDESVETPTPWYVLYVWSLVQGEYTLSITGTFDGTFTVELELQDKKRGRKLHQIEGTIEAGQNYSFILSFHPDNVDQSILRSITEDFSGTVH